MKQSCYMKHQGISTACSLPIKSDAERIYTMTIVWENIIAALLPFVLLVLVIAGFVSLFLFVRRSVQHRSQIAASMKRIEQKLDDIANRLDS